MPSGLLRGLSIVSCCESRISILGASVYHPYAQVVIIADAYAPRRPNLLNVIRLLLAVGVIVWHSTSLTGKPYDGVAAEFLGAVFVDGFFAVSGFLILRSWVRNPKVAEFLAARALRIFPAFWLCLVVTGLLFAPLSQLLAGSSPGFQADNALYIVRNAALWIFQFGIQDTLQDVPYPGVWNGSLWTLAWEFLCYLAVLGLGLLGLWKYRWSAAAALGVVWLASAFSVDDVIGSDNVTNALRFSLMFLSGCVLAQFQDRIRISWAGAAAAAALVAASVWLPDYRLLGGPALAYLLIAIGGLVSRERLGLRNDISYGVYIYAFPVQQLLATWGGANSEPLMFALLATILTVPLAMLSWFGLERPMIRMRRKVTRPVRPASTARG